jgi:CheY-like chemotaxis protein/anti-sigma regulatory factor (Ser/Thr protein kinase)
LADKKKLTLTMCDVEYDAVANIDHHRLQQVLGNMLSNAIKFSEVGKTIKLGVRFCGEHQTELWIQDQGLGMDEYTIQSIKETGKIKGRVGTQGEKSNGLGLAICKKVIEAHQGTLDVTSEVGKGSRFMIRLDAISTDLLPSEVDDVSGQNKNMDELDLKSKKLGRVLLVDDEPLNLKLLKAILNDHCEEIQTFTDPRDLVDCSEHWDLLISDQEMPHLRGVELIKVLKAKGKVERAILLSAHHYRTEELSPLYESGVDHVLRKPLTKTALFTLF